MRLGVRTTDLLRVAVVATIAASAGACSTVSDVVPDVPEWVDPTTWFGDDSANAADNGQTPDLAGIPDKPPATTPDDQQELADSLASDRSNAKYSADALRGGTEAAAAPPPDMAPAPAVAENETPAPTSAQAQAAPPPRQVAAVDRSIAREPSGSSMPGTLPATPSGIAAVVPPPEQQVQTAALPAPPPAPQTSVANAAPVQSYAPPTGAQPALPPAPVAAQRVAAIEPSDAALGFKPSTAPPLDPTVSQFVPAPIINRYRQTAAGAGMGAGAAPVNVATNRPARKLRRPAPATAMGGPEQMSGAVVANLDAIQTSAPVSTPSVYSNARGMPATAVLYFPGDSVRLNGEARTQARAAAEQFLAGGSRGFIRVVGHSSSRTANMSPERHMEIIFRKSQERANAVAQEIIRSGVPADKVLVEAVGDTQPVYYESMPKGEEGNRRAEIFLQS